MPCLIILACISTGKKTWLQAEATAVWLDNNQVLSSDWLEQVGEEKYIN